MDSTRRDFLGRMAAGAAVLGVAPFSAVAAASDLRALDPATVARQQGQKWDLSWIGRITGKHKAVFDVPEVESGYGVWRASIWVKQYGDVLGVPARDMTPVLVLRHNAIALAMQQSYWDKYGVGKKKSVTHPITLEPTDRNPALLNAKAGDIPEMFTGVSLGEYVARGGIALACDLALQDCVGTIQSTDGVSPEEARKRALAYMVPGVILQPSGVFAALRAQDAGCTYLRAS
jgi:hypothetical protein